jgi:hypothetical protein
VLPGRGPPRRPATRVHPARPRDELRRRGRGDGLRRVDGRRGLARGRPRAPDPGAALPALHLRRRDGPLRLGQA